MSLSVKAQFVNSGTEPATLGWNQIELEHYIVIFPDGAENIAKTYAMKLELAYKFINHSAGFQPKKYAYVLHNYSASSNGLTAVAPNRVELWTKPHQDIYGQAWDEQLIIHEGRHIAQFTSMYRGASKLPIWLTGQMGYAFPLGLYVPNWFMEGDAVLTETVLSSFGRGRLSNFEKGMRAYFLQKGDPGYAKMMLGSYKEKIPNHYEAGYQVVAANRAFRDNEIFKEKLEAIARYPWFIWPFSRKSNGLKDTRKLKYYKFAADTLMQLWKQQDIMINAKHLPDFKALNDYSGLEYVKTSGEKIFAMERSMDNVPRIVEIGSNETKKIITLGYGSGKYFDVRGDEFVFTLEMPDGRWEQVSTSDIFIFNEKSGEKLRLTKGGFYSAPVINEKGDKIAAVSVEEGNKYFITVLDRHTGKVLYQLANENNDYLITPQWLGDSIVYIKVTEQGKVLAVSDKQSECLLLTAGNIDIKHPYVKNDSVYFVGDWSGIENIYRISLSGGEPERITNVRFGAISPVFVENKLCYLDYSYKGNSVSRLSRKMWLNEPLALVENHSLQLYSAIADAGGIDFSVEDTASMHIKKYNKFLHQFNFHSWLPVAAYTLAEGAYIPGISVVSQSLLNDATAVLGYNYMENNRDEKVYFNYIYSGFFPVIHLNAYWGDYDQNVYVRSTSTDGLDDASLRLDNMRVNSYRLETKIGVPLSKRYFDYSLMLEPSVYASFGKRYYKSQSSDLNIQTQGYYFGGGFFAYMLKQKAYRDIYSPLGFTLRLNYQKYTRTQTAESDYAKSSRGVAVNAFFPGLAKHHSLQMYSSYLKMDQYSPLNMVYTQPINMAVGWQTIGDEAYGEHNYRLGGAYYFPLGNIDKEITWLANIKRLNFGVWADYGRFEGKTDAEAEWISEYSIVGATTYADMNLFRYPVEFKLGAKVGYSLSHEKPYIQVIFNYSL